MKNVPPEVLERIKKMLRLAEDDGASEGEVENALRFARQIMAKYDLAEAEILLDEDRRTDTIDQMIQMNAVTRAGGLDKLEKDLAWVINHVCDVRHMWRTSKKISKSGNRIPVETLVFYGLPRDVAIGVYLFVQLFATAKAMSRVRNGPGWRKPHWDYCKGFIHRLIQRSREMRKGSDATAGAIVLAKDSMLNQYTTQAFPNMKTAIVRSQKIHDWKNYKAGMDDANNVSLSTSGLADKAPKSSPVKELTDGR